MKIGIFAGTFDPVHNGHIAFALAAIRQCALDKVVFLPQRDPQGKQNVTAFKDRLAMLRLATGEYAQLETLTLPAAQFTIATTLPALQKYFAGHELTFLFGSDVARSLPSWPDAQQLFTSVTIAVGQRSNDTPPQLPIAFKTVVTAHSAVAASQVRSGQSRDILPKVGEYIRNHHLYSV